MEQVSSVGLPGGSGFTMSIVMTLLMYDNPEHITRSTNARLISSPAARNAGYVGMRLTHMVPQAG